MFFTIVLKTMQPSIMKKYKMLKMARNKQFINNKFYFFFIKK